MTESVWAAAFELGRSRGPYAERQIPSSLVAQWLSVSEEKEPAKAAAAAAHLEHAADLYGLGRRRSAGPGPPPSEIVRALSKIDRGAQEIAAGFGTLVGAATRAGQAESEYGEAARAMMKHLGLVLLTWMVTPNPEGGTAFDDFINKAVPWSEVRESQVFVNLGFHAAFIKLSERAQILALEPLHEATRVQDDYQRRFVQELANIWSRATGKAPAVSKKENYQSPFHRFVATVYAYLAGLEVATLEFEQEQALLAERPDPESHWDHDVTGDAVAILQSYIEDVRKRRPPSAGTIKAWLTSEGAI